MVVISGAELFTGNTMMCLAVMQKQTTLVKMLRNWAVVYIGNFLGAVLIAWMVSVTGLWESGGQARGYYVTGLCVWRFGLPPERIRF